MLSRSVVAASSVPRSSFTNGDAPPGSHVDLTFAAILAELDLPRVDQHDAYADALMTAMIYLRLSDLKQRGQRLARSVYQSRAAFTAG